MNYSYDAASQLTGISYTQGGTTLGDLTYAYDAAGRRTVVGGSFARTGVPQAAAGASYNANNQLTSWKGAALTYDLNGNLTSDGSNTYTWNARNQLVAISGTVSASFQYDAFGRRVSKTIGGTTQYLYDGANPVQEMAGTSVSANLLAAGIDEYFQRTDSAGSRSFLTDALGSTLALADSSGTLQTSYTYEPFGNTTVSGAASTNSFAFTGRELDPTGLYFYRARYHNPVHQRFLSEDPARFHGGSPDFYTYVLDDPANRDDPFGLYTLQAGVNVSFTAFGVTVSRFVGVVVDDQGNVAVYKGYGGGAGVGAGFEGGLSFAVSNAYNVCGIGGPFAQASGTAGIEGAAATGDYFAGSGNGPNGLVQGAGATIGIGGGASASTQITNTTVIPLHGRKKGGCP